MPDEALSKPAAGAAPVPEPAFDAAAQIESAHPQRPHTRAGPRFVSLSRGLGSFVVLVSVGGIAAGALGFVFGPTQILGLLAVIALVAGGQALALELDGGSISVSAVARWPEPRSPDPRPPLPLAIATAAVEELEAHPIYQLPSTSAPSRSRVSRRRQSSTSAATKGSRSS